MLLSCSFFLLPAIYSRSFWCGSCVLLLLFFLLLRVVLLLLLFHILVLFFLLLRFGDVYNIAKHAYLLAALLLLVMHCFRVVKPSVSKDFCFSTTVALCMFGLSKFCYFSIIEMRAQNALYVQ